MNLFKRNGSKLPTKGMLTIRVVVGGYLMYLAYSLFTDSSSGMPRWQVTAFSAFFVVAGAVIIGLTAYLYFNGMYEGGKWDVPDETESEADAPVVVDTEAVEVTAEETTVEEAAVEERANEESVTEETTVE